MARITVAISGQIKVLCSAVFSIMCAYNEARQTSTEIDHNAGVAVLG